MVLFTRDASSNGGLPALSVRGGVSATGAIWAYIRVWAYTRDVRILHGMGCHRENGVNEFRRTRGVQLGTEVAGTEGL